MPFTLGLKFQLLPTRDDIKFSVPLIAFLCENFRNKIRFYGEELLTHRSTPKLEDHRLSAVRDCLLNIFTATLHIGGRSPIRNLRTYP